MRLIIFFNIFFTFLFQFLIATRADSVILRDTSQVLRPNNSPIYKIKNQNKKNLNATAFFINENQVITNFHVLFRMSKDDGASLNDLKLYQKDHETGEELPQFEIKKIKALSHVYDLALLEVEGKSDSYFNLRKTPLDPNEDLLIIGRPSSSNISRMLKKVGPLHLYPNHTFQSFFFREYRVESPLGIRVNLLLGMSGSPVLDNQGEIVGVFTSKIRNSNLIFFTNLKTVKSFIQNPPYLRENLSLKEALNQTIQSTHDQAEQGHVDALFKLGEYYHNLFRKEENEESSKDSEDSKKNPIIFFKKAAKKGHILAILLLNENQETLNKVERDNLVMLDSLDGFGLDIKIPWYIWNKSQYIFDTRISQLKTAAELGSGDAMVKLMEVYMTIYRNGFLDDLDQAIHWALKAAEQDYIPLFNSLEDDIKKRDPIALKIFKAVFENNKEKLWVQIWREILFSKGKEL